MPNLIKLNIDAPMLDPNTGKSVRLISTSKAIELGIKTEFEMQQRIDDFPESVLGNIITTLFDATPIPSSSLFSIYNEITIDIRKARQSGKNTIDISKDSLEKFKTIFSGNPPQDPKNNRNVAFVLECIEMAFAKSITETIPTN